MKYLSEQEIKSLLTKNEEQNLSYREDNIVFSYDLVDTVNGTQSTVGIPQKSKLIKVDGEEYYIVFDQYKDYAPFDMLIPVNSDKIVSVEVGNSKYFSVEEETKRTSDLLVKKVGGVLAGKSIPKPFSSIPELQELLEKSAKEVHLKHVETYTRAFISKMGEIQHLYNLNDISSQDKDIEEGVGRIIVGNKTFLSKVANTFENNLNSVFDNIKVQYDDILARRNIEFQQEQKTLREKRDSEIQQRAVLKAYVESQDAKEFLIQKFGYYPIVDFKFDEVAVSFHDKNDKVLDVITLKTTDTEINYYSEKEHEDSYLYIRHISDESFASIPKDLEKKYYHTIFDLRYSIILNNKNDYEALDEVVEKYIEKLPDDKDENLLADDKFSLSKIMKNNFSSNVRLEHVNKEMDEKFNKKQKLKP